MEVFDSKALENLVMPSSGLPKGKNGQVTIIGGSGLFHGAPLLALTTASKLVDMVYFASPDPSVGRVAEKIKSELFSFIWIPWKNVGQYIEKSDAILIGPGFMRTPKTKRITKRLLGKFAHKKWVIDAGSLQMVKPEWIPSGAILTPNQKEYQKLFGSLEIEEASKKYDCTIVYKLPETIICSPSNCIKVIGGNAGLTKGGTGDVQAGLTVGLLVKNEPFLAGAAASYLVKKAADRLFEEAGTVYNADDLMKAVQHLFATK